MPRIPIAALLTALVLANVAPAQPKAKGPAILSPEVKADRSVTFRLFAPKAEAVALDAGDIPGGGSRALKKSDTGIWELTLGPVDAGTFRYLFNVDGVFVVDPRNQTVSESNGNIRSVVHVPGADFMDRKDVPHGTVSRVYYHSSA